MPRKVNRTIYGWGKPKKKIKRLQALYNRKLTTVKLDASLDLISPDSRVWKSVRGNRI